MTNIKKYLLLASCAVIFFIIGIKSGWYLERLSAVNDRVYASVLAEDGRYEQALSFAYSSVKYDSSLSLELIGDIYFCMGKNETAVINYRLVLEQLLENLLQTGKGKGHIAFIEQKLAFITFESDDDRFEPKCN